MFEAIKTSADIKSLDTEVKLFLLYVDSCLFLERKDAIEDGDILVDRSDEAVTAVVLILVAVMV